MLSNVWIILRTWILLLLRTTYLLELDRYFKLSCLNLILNWIHSSLHDVRKNDIWNCSMSNSVNLVKALLGLMFYVHLFEANNMVLEFDHQYTNTFEFVRCSMKWCSTHHLHSQFLIWVEKDYSSSTIAPSPPMHFISSHHPTFGHFFQYQTLGRCLI